MDFTIYKIRDIEQLNSRIKTLESLLHILAPHIDLASLPRTADQARSIVNSNWHHQTHSHQIQPHQSSDLQEILKSMIGLDLNQDDLELHDHSNKTSNHLNLSGEPNLTHLMSDHHRSIVERSSELHHFRHAAHQTHFPTPELAQELIEIYFLKIHPYEYILHKPEFLRHYRDGLANRDSSFAGLCYAIFANSSRFSNDPRTDPPLDGSTSNPNRQAAGALYGAASLSLLTPTTLPCTLFDLQAMAVLAYFFIGGCSPMSAWFALGMFLRRGMFISLLVLFYTKNQNQNQKHNDLLFLV